MSRVAPDKLRGYIKAFAAIPQRTLPSLQGLESKVIDRATQKLCERGDKYVSEEDVETFLLWHGAGAEDIKELFKVMDRRPVGGAEQIPLQRFIIALSLLTTGPIEDNLGNLFRAFDENHDGVLTRTEFEYAMCTLFKVAAELANPHYNLGPHSRTRASVEASARYVTDLTFQHADLNGNNVLDIEEFKRWLLSSNDSALMIKTIIGAVGLNRGDVAV